MLVPDLIAREFGESAWVLKGKWRNVDRWIFRRSETKSLVVNHARGFRGDSLDFLAQIKDEVESLQVIVPWLTDYTAISECTKLSELTISRADAGGIDYTQLRGLRTLEANYFAGEDGIFSLPGLTRLSLSRYPFEDLSPLSALQNLADLELAESRSLRSLKGLEDLALKRLVVAYCRGLDDITDLARATSLSELIIESCGDVRSLRPISRLKQVTEVDFWGTRIEDGDLSMLDELPNLRDARFENRRHYNRKRDQYRLP